MPIIERLGAGSPVLLIHGSPSAPDAFGPMAKALTKAHRVLVWAMPGYAGAPRLEPYDLETIHRDIESTVGAEVDGPIDIVGFSMGAYHALALGIRARLRVRSIVSLAGLAGIPDEARAETRAMADAIRSGAVPREIFPPRMLSAAFLAEHPDATELMYRWLESTSLDVIADEAIAIADTPSLLPALRDTRFALLARVGELDVATPPPFSRAIVEAKGNGELQIVARAGHALIIEDADATIESVLRFLTP